MILEGTATPQLDFGLKIGSLKKFVEIYDGFLPDRQTDRRKALLYDRIATIGIIQTP
jgi:hypothetical protein